MHRTALHSVVRRLVHSAGLGLRGVSLSIFVSFRRISLFSAMWRGEVGVGGGMPRRLGFVGWAGRRVAGWGVVWCICGLLIRLIDRPTSTKWRKKGR